MQQRNDCGMKKLNPYRSQPRIGLSPERAGHCARRVALALIHGNAEEAYAIVDQALQMPEPFEGKTRQEKLAMALVEAGVDLRMSNALESVGIRTVEQLLHTPREYLLSIPNVGESMVRHAIQAILRLDL